MASSRCVVVDASCMLALVASWHERHEAVRVALERLLSTKHRLAVSAHSLVEAYAVLTRLPAPYRVSPDVAHDLIRKNFGRADVAALTSNGYWSLLERNAARGVAGGRSYDALIAQAASTVAPCVLLTLNARHFGPLDTPGVTIAEP